MLQTKLTSRIDISNYMLDQNSLNLVVPGDLITSQQGFMNGHGTYKIGNQIRSSVMGTVQITNKLIIVNPLKSKYSPQVGDIVVGRVIEIANKRWKIDIRASSMAYLSLNSTYIPEQRKKNQEDQFNMRKIMQQGDLIVAQVHSLNNDKTYNLHTRNPKYGQLQPGLLIEVSHRQIKRQKHHLISFGNIGMIMGNNGNIFLSNCKRNQALSSRQTAMKIQKYNQEDLKSIIRIGNLLKLLSFQGLQVSELLIKQLIDFTIARNIQSSHILSQQSEIKQELLNRVRERIPRRIQQISSSLKKQ